VEVVLGFIVLYIIGLWYYYHHRRNHLKCDPASIANVMEMFHSGRLAIHENGLRDGHEKVAPENGTFYGRHRLLENPVSRVSTNEVKEPFVHCFNLTQATIPNNICSITRHFELRRSVGMSFIFIILLSVSGLIFLNLLSIKINGIFLSLALNKDIC
jgi:hypothetical protein